MRDRAIVTGLVLYALGNACGSVSPCSYWLIPAGSLLILAGLTLPAREGVPAIVALRPVLLVLCLGMVLEAVMRLPALRPEPLWASLGPPDALRPRLLRLARASALALPVLAQLYRGLAARAPRLRVVRCGGWAMICGAAGMPLLLTATALSSLSLKYLLALPADAVFAGTLVGAWLARRYARPPEWWGWLLIAASMAMGLLMGTYAFDGPLPAPGVLGEYGEFPRRLVRLAHAGAVVLGMLGIVVARLRDARGSAKHAPGEPS